MSKKKEVKLLEEKSIEINGVTVEQSQEKLGRKTITDYHVGTYGFDSKEIRRLHKAIGRLIDREDKHKEKVKDARKS